MVVHSLESKKRKQPPTFRHLPRNRAQKLKKSWIEKKKLKLRWKAQKAKEGLDSGWPDRSNPRHAQDEGQEHSKKVDEHDRSRIDRASSLHVASDSEDKDNSNGSERPPLPRGKAQTAVPQPDPHSRRRERHRPGPAEPSFVDDAKEKNTNANETNTSLRDLARRAYAPSSLHTQKADPLHRRKGALTSNRSSRRSHSGHSKEKDEGRQQRRGQPNMKFRMEVTLERIKRDYS